MSSVTWLVLSDFNVTLSMSELSDYFLGMQISSQVTEFQDCIGNVGLTDIHGTGFHLTWNNKRIRG